jgi:hypothetical protein
VKIIGMQSKGIAKANGKRPVEFENSGSITDKKQLFR